MCGPIKNRTDENGNLQLAPFFLTSKTLRKQSFRVMSFPNDTASSISLVILFLIHCGKAKEKKHMLIQKRNDSAMDQRIHKRNWQYIETREIEIFT